MTLLFWLSLWLFAANAQEPEAPAPQVPPPPAPEAPAPEVPPAEPAPEGEPVPPEEQASEEIIVWGRLAVAKARDDIVHQMERLGYHVSRRKDGRTIFRGRRTGKVTLLPSGELVFGVAPPRLVELPSESYTQDPRYEPLVPERTASDPGITPVGKVTVAFPGGPKVQAVRDQILEETRDEIEAYVKVVRRTAFEEALLALPDRLDRLWADGVPLDPNDPPLSTPEARRRAVLEHWATRADTPEGLRTREAIEAWLAAVVQTSDHPVTDAERAEFQALGGDGRPLP